MVKHRKQGAKISKTNNCYQTLPSGVSKRSMLGSVLVNLFINDLFLFINEAEILNFASILYFRENNLTKLLNVSLKILRYCNELV